MNLPYRIAPAGNTPYAWEIHDLHGRRIGTLLHDSPTDGELRYWHILDAGKGIKRFSREQFVSMDGAIDEVLRARDNECRRAFVEGSTLTGEEMDVLVIEQRWFARPPDCPRKLEAIRLHFGDDYTGYRYWQVLVSLVDKPAARVYSPALIARLEDLLEKRREERPARRAAAMRATAALAR